MLRYRSVQSILLFIIFFMSFVYAGSQCQYAQQKNLKNVVLTLVPVDQVKAKKIFGTSGQGGTEAKDAHLDAFNKNFKTLHRRYLVIRVAIQNNSKQYVVVRDSRLTGENYIKIRGLVYTPLEEILEHYLDDDVVCALQKMVAATCGVIVMGNRLPLFYGVIRPQLHIRDRRIIDLFYLLVYAGSTALMTHAVALLYFRKKLQDNLKAYIDDLNHGYRDTSSEKIIIPPGACFQDLMFVNQGYCPHLLQQNLNNCNTLKPSLVYELCGTPS